ncbi:MAG: DUF1761 domain-containing protein [Sphingomonadales bacterium]|jgi:hypothetical protein
MYLESLNWLAIVAATIAAMVVGGIWYSPPVAGKKWMELTNFNPETAPKPGAVMAKATFANFIVAIMLAGILQRMGYQALIPGAATGALLGALFIGPAIWPNYGFEGKPIKLFLIHMGNTVIGLAAMGAILGAWT